MAVNDKNVLVAPINLEEAYNYMGATSSNSIYDVVAICTYSGINKWAKFKPIRYNKKGVLTDAERAGDFTAHSEGVYYGLKLSNTAARIDTLHNATFEYQRVRGGVDWSRLSDFDGYDKNARPNPVGAVDDYIYLDLHPAHGNCNITYSELNTTGVNIADAIKAMDASNDLGSYYPCVLVTIDGTMYARALWNLNVSFENLNSEATKYAGFTTMRHGGAWNLQWCILLNGLPNAIEGKELTATVFFCKAIGSEGNAAVPNLKQWLAVDNMITAGVCFACPDAVAKKITLANYFKKGIDIVGGTWNSFNTSTGVLSVSLATQLSEPQAGATYTLKAYLYDSGGTQIGSVTQTLPTDVAITNCDFATSLIFVPDTATFTVQWEVYNSNNPAVPCNKGTTTIAKR